MIPIIMPQVGQDIPTAKIIEWRKRENEPVEKGEVVLIVESDKAAFEVEAEQSGVLLKILHKEGEEVEIFQPLAYIGHPGETIEVESKTPAADSAATQASLLEQRMDQPPLSDVEGEPDVVLASPSARRAARELGMDLKHVKGTGPHNRITKRDVLAAVSSSPSAVEALLEKEVHRSSPEDTVIPFDKMRKRIADRLTLSKQTIPHFYLLVDVDMTEALMRRKTLNRQRGTDITITDLIVKACALALGEFERMNAHVDNEKVIIKKRINIGIATSVEKGLLVPVIADADQKTLSEISEISKKNAEAARRGFVAPKDIGTFTITTLGMHSIREYLPIINPPECGILAVGTVEKRVVPRDESVAVRHMMTLTLASDHRAVDGPYAARFLNRIKDYLEGGFSGDRDLTRERVPGALDFSMEQAP